MSQPPRIFKRKLGEIESAERQRTPLQPFQASSSPVTESRSLPPPQVAPVRLTARPPQAGRSSDANVPTSEQMKALQILQRENPADQAKMEQFVKASLVYQLGALFKNQQEIIKDQLEIKRAIALQNQGSQTTRKEAELRAAVRPIIRHRLILSRYDDAFWSNAGKVFADVKLELNDDFNELEGAVRVVGKVRTEEKAKQKDRLLRAQDLLERPLSAFANCVRCDVGNPQTQYVQDGLDLWEAAARWRWVLTNMDEPRDRNFWSVVDKVFAEMDSSWEFFQQDVDEFGFEEAAAGTDQIIDLGLTVD